MLDNPGLQAIVLIVEDEPVQRMMLTDIVEDAGFRVLEAWDAASAIALLEKSSDVRLVLTDIDVPGSMDGLKLAAAVRDRWPPIEIIVTTAGRAPAPCDLPPRAIFVPKPIQSSELVKAITCMASHVAH